jgi:NAD(P)-dependent dehydrogenase (short-subunit alcohol dehydrogenase family)
VFVLNLSARTDVTKAVAAKGGMAFPSPTKDWHATPYASISPTRPELSTKDKTVVITGGGAGIGRSFAHSFAASGAKNIILIGRTGASLAETRAELQPIFPSTKFVISQADIADSNSINAAFTHLMESLGGGGSGGSNNCKIDTLVANAGYMHQPASLATGDPDDWWRGFEVNVRGNYNLIRAFFPHAASDATVLHVSSGADHLPYVPGLSGYAASKLAATKVFDYLHAENSGLHVRQFHPGMIEDTETGRKSGVPGQDDRKAIQVTLGSSR